MYIFWNWTHWKLITPKKQTSWGTRTKHLIFSSTKLVAFTNIMHDHDLTPLKLCGTEHLPWQFWVSGWLTFQLYFAAFLTIPQYQSCWAWSLGREESRLIWLQWLTTSFSHAMYHFLITNILIMYIASASVKDNVLVLGVGNLVSALQPPHCFPHVFGLQRWCVSPLLTNV